MKKILMPVAVLVAALGAVALAQADRGPIVRASSVCADFPNQAAAQTASNTQDSDGDGIFCESLPCPCSAEWHAQHGGTPSAPTPPTPADPKPAPAPTCAATTSLVRIGISRTRYPAVIKHMTAAIRAGWPKIMTLNRKGADQRRDRALRGWVTRRGYDRDEWPMAVGRRTWKTHVAYVPSGQNRGAGASIGVKLRQYCDGVRFVIVGY